jgi:hypothetical protein
MRVKVRPEAAAPFVLRSDGGDWRLEEPPVWVEGIPLAAEVERGLASTAQHLRAATLTVTLSDRHPGVTVVASTSRDPAADGDQALAGRRAHEQALLRRWAAASWCRPPMPSWWSACRRASR